MIGSIKKIQYIARTFLDQSHNSRKQKIFQIFATSCIDISDGLIKDLGDICKQSNVGAELCYEDIPILNDHKDLTHGDDYELCFTAPCHLDDQLKIKDSFLSGK